MISQGFFGALKPIITSGPVGTADIGYFEGSSIEVLDSVLNLHINTISVSSLGITNASFKQRTLNQANYYVVSTDGSINKIDTNSSDITGWFLSSVYTQTHRGGFTGITQLGISPANANFSMPEVSPYYTVATMDSNGGSYPYPSNGLGTTFIPGCVSFLSSGSQVIVGRGQGSSTGGQYKVYTVTTGALVRTMGAGGFVSNIQPRPGSTTEFAAIEAGAVVVRNQTTAATIATLHTGIPDQAYDILYSPNGQYIAVISYKTSTQLGSVKIFNASASYALITTFSITSSSNQHNPTSFKAGDSLCWNSDGSKLLAVNCVYDTTEWNQIGFVDTAEDTNYTSPFFLY